MKHTKPAHDRRDDATGRYKTSYPCDSCGKPVGTDYLTDDEVCDGSDGPGFFLCERKRCEKLPGRASADVEVRRAHYTAGRAAADAKEAG
jgi:hypothetical protein